MYQDTKDKFQPISLFVKDTEKYVKDIKLNKSGDGNGSRAVFDDVDCFRSQG